MRECKKCRSSIPDGLQLCPHCELLPPTLYPQFFLYAALTLIAVFCAVYFRPFAGGSAIGEAAQGTLWVAFVIFSVFALIFLFVSLVLLRAYRHRSFRGKISKAERAEFIRIKKHIDSGSHCYEGGKYCTVCGHRR